MHPCKSGKDLFEKISTFLVKLLFPNFLEGLWNNVFLPGSGSVLKKIPDPYSTYTDPKHWVPTAPVPSIFGGISRGFQICDWTPSHNHNFDQNSLIVMQYFYCCKTFRYLFFKFTFFMCRMERPSSPGSPVSSRVDPDPEVGTVPVPGPEVARYPVQR